MIRKTRLTAWVNSKVKHRRTLLGLPSLFLTAEPCLLFQWEQAILRSREEEKGLMLRTRLTSMER